MKNEMFDLSEKNLKNWIGRVYAGYSKQSHPIDRFRHLGGLEILLALAGKLNLDGKLEYKEIEVPKYFLGFEQTKKTKIKRERYPEMIERITQEYLNETEK